MKPCNMKHDFPFHMKGHVALAWSGATNRKREPSARCTEIVQQAYLPHHCTGCRSHKHPRLEGADEMCGVVCCRNQLPQDKITMPLVQKRTVKGGWAAHGRL